MRIRIIITICILSLFYNCAPSFGPDGAKRFERWFVSPWGPNLRGLIAFRFTPHDLDSLVGLMRKDAPSGELTVELNDSSGAPYTLGYLTPPAIKPDTLYPLIIYLHGGTGTTITNKGAKAWDMLRPLSDSFNLYLASPSANRYAPWWSPSGISRVLQSLRYMTLHYPVDPDRIFLAGVSDGGTGCFAIANTTPGPFAGFFAISGFGPMLSSVNAPVVPANLSLRHIYSVNGGKDRLYPSDVVSEFCQWLTKNGAKITCAIHQNEPHGFDYRASEMGYLADYIRTWKRPHPTGSLSWVIVPGFQNNVPEIKNITLNLAPKKEAPAISVLLHSDTLRVRTTHVTGFDYIAPGDQEKLTVLSLDGKQYSAKRLLKNNATCLELMVHNSYPKIYNEYIFKIATR